MRTVAMLDSGADQTYIAEQTAIDLKMQKISEPVSATINQFEGKTQIKTWQVEVLRTKGTSKEALDAIFLEQIKKGYIEEITDLADINREDCNYIPYFPVV